MSLCCTTTKKIYTPCTSLLPWQVAFLAGVCGIFCLRYPKESLLWLIILWLAWLAFGGRAKIYRAMSLAYCIGYILAYIWLPSSPVLPPWVGNGQAVLIHAQVAEVHSKADKRCTVLLEHVQCTLNDGSHVSLPGLLQWNWHYPTQRIWPEQSISLRTRIDPIENFGNTGAWDYAFSQKLKNIHCRIYSRGFARELYIGEKELSLFQQWKENLKRHIAQHSSGQGGAMLAALLTGDRFFLTPDSLDVLRRAGLAHTLALSGLHLGFILIFATILTYCISCICPPLLLYIPRPKLMLFVSLPLVLAYLCLGDFAPSLLRASCMFGFMALHLLFGKARFLLDSLFVALLSILLISPLLAFDIRLQLSALAVAGIAVFFPILQHYYVSGKKNFIRWPLSILLVSICATFVLLPMTAKTFGVFSPNLLLNIIWLPLLACLVMPLGLIGLLTSFFLPSLASTCFALAAYILQNMLHMLTWLQGEGFLPLIQLLRPLWPEMLGAWLLICCLAFVITKRTIPWWTCFFGLSLLIWPHIDIMVQDSKINIRVSVLDVGEGQSVLITAPGGKRTLIDGGGFFSRTFDAGRDVLAPMLTLGRPPRLSTIILSHPDADHYKGLLHLLKYFEVGSFAHNGELPQGKYRNLFKEALENIPMQKLMAGDSLSLGQNLTLEVLHPSSTYIAPTSNDSSLVLRLMRGVEGLCLVCGDIETTAIETLLHEKRVLRAQTLVLPHHGAVSSLSLPFYRAVSPHMAACSSGRYTHNIHPHPKVLATLAKQNCPTFSTWQKGMIEWEWQETGSFQTFFPAVK